MKPKIVLDCRYWGPSHTGLGRYTQSLATAIVKLNRKFTLYALTNRDINLPSAKITQIRCLATPYSLAEQTEIITKLKTIKPDLTHFFHFNAPIMYRGPFIATIHDLIKHHSKGIKTSTRTIFTYPFKRLGYQLTVKNTVGKAKNLIVPSNWVKNDLFHFYPESKPKTQVIYEAADSHYFLPLAKKYQQEAPSYPYLIYVGNTYPHKNVAGLIKAIGEYRRQNKSKLKLIIVTGRNVFYQRLRTVVRTLSAQPYVKIKDFSSDNELKALYKGSQGFITASLFEGFGLPGLEAMASGTLVAASNIPSFKEIYQNHAIYFDPLQTDSIVKAIAKLVATTPSDRKKMLATNLKYAKTFSWDKAAAQTLKVYENCLNLRSRQ